MRDRSLANRVHALRTAVAPLAVLLQMSVGVARAAEPIVGDRLTALQNYQRLRMPVPYDLETLVARGEDLFFRETFGGNTRTCGTCHPATNNLTIDPAFIATLPPDDPLFVAEFNADLRDLELPPLMRQHGLILENLDGFEVPGVLRGVPHTLALGTSLASHREAGDNLGWSGDGAPGPGTLRAFAVGAVRQHFTRTLRRVEGEDFMLPTEEQLDALQAFLLSTGRRMDPDLASLRMLDQKAEKGRVLFITVDTENGTRPAAKCNLCHFNGGAGSLLEPGVNILINTGAVNDEKRPPGLPADDGFESGSGLFNAPPLVEAADTGPWFHANSRQANLKEAIAFYDSDAFKRSPAAALLRSLDSGGLLFKGLEFDSLAAFLRVLNAAENIRSAARFQERSGTHSQPAALLGLALADLDDAIRVLTEGGLHADAVSGLRTAYSLTQQASVAEEADARNALVDDAIVEERAAHATMIVDPAVDDGNACTTGETCSGGICIGGAPLDCDDGNVCTDDSCHPAMGCEHTSNETACGDGNAHHRRRLR